jgi:hypothetical protein
LIWGQVVANWIVIAFTDHTLCGGATSGRSSKASGTRPEGIGAVESSIGRGTVIGYGDVAMWREIDLGVHVARPRGACGRSRGGDSSKTGEKKEESHAF